MLTLAYILTELFKEKERTFCEDLKRALEKVKQKMDIDNVFINNYKVHVFPILQRLDSDWRFQVDNLHELWNTAADIRNRAESWISFTPECFQFELPFEEYDIEAFDKARKE